MLYGSETWCLRENEMAILRRTESDGESNVWCKTDGEKENRRPNGEFKDRSEFSCCCTVDLSYCLSLLIIMVCICCS